MDFELSMLQIHAVASLRLSLIKEPLGHLATKVLVDLQGRVEIAEILLSVN